MTLSKRQFEGLAVAANEGGFSVRPEPGPAGEVQQITNSYMVGGVAGSTGDSLDSPIGGRSIVHFMRDNRAALANPEAALGAWHDTERTPVPQVDLDVSDALPRTPAGKQEAASRTLTRNEMAFGEIGESPTDYTEHTNPFSSRRSFKGHRKALRSDPKAYEAVVSGNVLGGMSSWVADK